MTSSNFQDISPIDLIALCINNDTVAWEEFVKRFRRSVMLYALRVARKYDIGDKDIPETVQEVFLRLLANNRKSLREFRGTSEEEIHAYLFQVVRSVIADQIRKQSAQRRTAEVISLDSFLDENGVSLNDLLSAGNESSPEWLLDKKISPTQLQEILTDILSGENAPRDAIIFYLYAVNGLTAREIAQLPSFNTNVANVQSIIFRTRERLRDLLNQKKFPISCKI